MTDREFTIPKPTYLCQVTIYGETFSREIKAGETATPLYNPVTKTISWKVEAAPKTSQENQDVR